MDGDEHQKRSVLITGCTTGGIGHALALELQREGFYVIATARNLDKMKDLVDHYLIETVQLDVCDPASISSARVAVEKLLEGSGLDILINNAGGDNNPAPAIEMDLQAAQDILDLNFFGAVRLIKAFSPMLMQSGSGRIVNISSGASIVPIPFLSAYGAAKAALNQYSDILRVELEPFNVAVTTVITGSVANSKDRSKLDLDLSPDSRYHGIRPVYNEAMQRNATQKLMPTEDYAKRLVWELMGSRPAQTLYIGRDSWYAWLMTTFAPRSWIHWLMVKMWGLKRSGSEKKTA